MTWENVHNVSLSKALEDINPKLTEELLKKYIEISENKYQIFIHTLCSWNQWTVHSKGDTVFLTDTLLRICFVCSSQLCTGEVRAVPVDTGSASGLMMSLALWGAVRAQEGQGHLSLGHLVKGKSCLSVATDSVHKVQMSLPISVQKKCRIPGSIRLEKTSESKLWPTRPWHWVLCAVFH